MKYTVEVRADRGTPRVIWYENGQRRTKNFSTKTDAEVWAKDMQAMADIGASPAEILAAKREAAGTGIAMDELVRAGLEHVRNMGATRADGQMTFAQAAETVIENARRSGARDRTIEGYRATYKVLNANWGPRAAAFISERDVENYLLTLPGRRGPASPAYKESAVRHIRMAMRCAGVAEPLRRIVVPHVKREVDFFTIEECRRMLETTPERERGFLAVALFAGIRPENLELLPADAVSVRDKRIRIPGHISKDTNTHLLESDVVPDVLWKWLKRWPYQPVKLNSLQRRLKRAAGRWVHDGMRHTAATYYCSLKGVSATARLLTHQGESLVRKHYAGVIEQSRARQFYAALTPEKIKFKVREPRARSDVKWPEDDVIASMLAKDPAVRVAEKLGCSDSALGKHCKRRGITKPGRGHWTRVEFGVEDRSARSA